jgi:hypothetical protein
MIVPGVLVIENTLPWRAKLAWPAATWGDAGAAWTLAHTSGNTKNGSLFFNGIINVS